MCIHVCVCIHMYGECPNVWDFRFFMFMLLDAFPPGKHPFGAPTKMFINRHHFFLSDVILTKKTTSCVGCDFDKLGPDNKQVVNCVVSSWCSFEMNMGRKTCVQTYRKLFRCFLRDQKTCVQTNRMLFRLLPLTNTGRKANKS